MTKTHVIKDESLGGIEREYVEVERKAEVGDRVIGKFGHSHVVTKVAKNGDVFMAEAMGSYSKNYYRTLEPSDIVHIDGKRFRMVDRKAEVGERVLIIGEIDPNHFGRIGVVSDCYSDEDVSLDYREILDYSPFVFREDYRVLIPADSVTDSPQSQDDIIANLVRRVSQLESELTGAKRDIETWAQEVEALKHEAVQRSLSKMDSKQITLDVDTLAKLIGGAR